MKLQDIIKNDKHIKTLAKYIFDNIDQDKTGYLVKQELMQVMTNLAIDLKIEVFCQSLATY